MTLDLRQSRNLVFEEVEGARSSRTGYVLFGSKRASLKRESEWKPKNRPKLDTVAVSNTSAATATLGIQLVRELLQRDRQAYGFESESDARGGVEVEIEAPESVISRTGTRILGLINPNAQKNLGLHGMIPLPSGAIVTTNYDEWLDRAGLGHMALNNSLPTDLVFSSRISVSAEATAAVSHLSEEELADVRRVLDAGDPAGKWRSPVRLLREADASIIGRRRD